MTQLVLSLFPGIGLLDMAFEEEGFCVVRGPDLLWGGDIKRFHPPAGKFDGIIGGPPCPHWTALGAMARASGKNVEGDLIPQFTRVVRDAYPDWFLMENVLAAPTPQLDRLYGTDSVVLSDVACGGVQRRQRRFTFGSHVNVGKFVPETLALFPHPEPTLTKKRTRWVAERARPEPTFSAKTWPDALRQQGLTPEFLGTAPFTLAGKFKVVANGVPLPMGRAVAKAVKRALGLMETISV